MKKIMSALAVSVVAVGLSACSAKAPAPATPAPAATQATQAPVPGKLALDYPIVATTSAKSGDYVLVPSKSTVEGLRTKTDSTVIFYAAKMVTPGANESEVQDLPGDTYSVPNSLILPLKSGESVKAGDLVATWWQSGSGLTQAIAETAGTTPKVAYLDSNMTSEDTLKENSFTKLTGSLDLGAVVAVKDGAKYTSAVLVGRADGKALVSGWAGSLKVVNESDLVALPIKPSVKAGDKVMAPVIGTYQEVTVKEVDAKKGLLKCTYDWAGSPSEENFFFGQVISNF